MVKLSSLWTPEKVIEFIVGCREDEGIPVFKTTYAGRELPYVLAICVGGHGRFPDSFKFYDVPEEDRKFLMEGTHDWERLLLRWNKHDLLEKLLRYKYYLPRSKGIGKVLEVV